VNSQAFVKHIAARGSPRNRIAVVYNGINLEMFRPRPPEFLAQERPVIVAARGEIRRLVEEAKAGLVIDPESAEQLAAAVLELRDRPEEAQARARAGREWVEANFDRDTLARGMAAFLAHAAGVRT